MAEKYSLPVIIHDREAHGDCFEMAIKYPNVKGIFHSYSGSSEMARELVKRGWYISFSGVVTFKNANRVREVLSTIPLDRLLIETDAPYLAPHPNRGKMNHSGNLEYTVGMIASVFGKAPEDGIMYHRSDESVTNRHRLIGYREASDFSNNRIIVLDRSS